MNYRGGNHLQARHKKESLEVPHWDDYQGPAAGVEFYRTFLEAALPHLAPDAAIYQWHADVRRPLLDEAWEQVGLWLHQIIIWKKPHGVPGNCHYMSQYEPCAYGWRTGHMPERRPPASATTVWEVDPPKKSERVHFAQKPIELFRRPIDYHTSRGDIVLDPFLGSGSCLIAAERRGRRCYGLEIDPANCQLIVARWEKMTGRKAVRL